MQPAPAIHRPVAGSPYLKTDLTRTSWVPPRWCTRPVLRQPSSVRPLTSPCAPPCSLPAPPRRSHTNAVHSSGLTHVVVPVTLYAPSPRLEAIPTQCPAASPHNRLFSRRWVTLNHLLRCASSHLHSAQPSPYSWETRRSVVKLRSRKNLDAGNPNLKWPSTTRTHNMRSHTQWKTLQTEMLVV